MKTILLSSVIFLFLIACGGKKTTTLPNFSTLSDTTDECKYMLEVCNEAKSFEKEFYNIPEDERKNMNSVMTSYVDHCESSESGCLESLEKK